MKSLTRQRVVNALWALVVAALYLAVNLRLLAEGHFHEDAYILFTYVENAVDGYGIAFYPGGEPTEGATDFLWLMALVAVSSLGIDVGVAAVIVNAAGVFVIQGLINSQLLSVPRLATVWRCLLVTLSPAWLLLSPVSASLGGFGVYFYLAAILLALSTMLHWRAYLAAPLAGLLVGLVRPDGVIIGVVITLVAAVVAECRGYMDRRRFLLLSALAAALGALYFAWRWSYFGHLLPLPLYVKGHVDGLPGLPVNLAALSLSLPMILATLLFALVNGRLVRLVLLMLPVAIHFSALLFAQQSQNVGLRFQAPLFMAIYYAFIVELAFVFAGKPSARRQLVACLLALFCAAGAFMGHVRLAHGELVGGSLKRAYIDVFPAMLGGVLPAGGVVVLTEAGRLPFWTRGNGYRIYDLVGLNTAAAATQRVDASYVASLQPDMLMFSHSGALDVSPEWSGMVVPVSADDLVVSAAHQGPALARMGKVDEAAVAALNYLRNHGAQYRVLLVDYRQDGSYQHVYALRRETVDVNAFRAALDSALLPGVHRGYLEMRTTP